MKLSQLKLDLGAINEGAWVDIPGMPGVRIKARGANCLAARRLRERLLAEATSGLKAGELPDLARREEVQRRLLAEVLVVDWEGIEGEDGPLPFDPSVLLDPAAEPLIDAASYAAMEVGRRRASDLERDLGN